MNKLKIVLKNAQTLQQCVGVVTYYFQFQTFEIVLHTYKTDEKFETFFFKNLRLPFQK